MSSLTYGQAVDFSGMDNIFNVDKFAESLMPEVRHAMNHARGAIVKRLPAGATGNLRLAPKVYVTRTPEGIKGTVMIPMVEKTAQYARIVEWGRAPGQMPPSQPGSSLYQWCSRKYTSAHYDKTKKVVRKTAQREKEIASMAFLVARKIGRKGTKPQHPFGLGWQEAAPEVARIIANGTVKALRDQVTIG